MLSARASGIATCVRLLAEAGAAGRSIEDYDAKNGKTPRGRGHHPSGGRSRASGEWKRPGPDRPGRELSPWVDDLDDTIRRLRAYVEAGAEVAYAPGLTNSADLRRLVSEVNAHINYLHRHNGPSLPHLASLGVSRVSTGGALTRVAYAAVEKAIEDLLAGAEPRLRSAELVE